MVYNRVRSEIQILTKGVDNMDKAKTILIVEDEDKLRVLIRSYLEREGLNVIEARDGKEGVETFKEKGAELVLLDVMLPVYDGWTACREIRKKSDVPIIMLTARGEENDKLFGFELGADDYIVKPFSMKELMATFPLESIIEMLPFMLLDISISFL